MMPSPDHTLIDRFLDGSATPEECSRLACAILDDPSTARAYAEATRLEAGLRLCLEPEAAARRLALAAQSEAPPRRHRGAAMLAAAAGLVVAGLSFAWWRPWEKTPSTTAASEKPRATPRIVTDAPPPPPSLRRPGTLSPEAAAVKRLASRYWLPDRMEFASTPLADAVAEVQGQMAAVNHRQEATIAAFAVDIPEEIAGHPVNASRAELPLAAWLETLSAQAGCELRFTPQGVAFDPVEQPDAMETRRFEMPSIADATLPAEERARLFHTSHPWNEEPDFRSSRPYGPSLAALWSAPQAPSSRFAVRDDGRSLEVRHTRRELRRIEGLLAVAAADAARPNVVFRAGDVNLAAPATGAGSVRIWDVTSGSAEEVHLHYPSASPVAIAGQNGLVRLHHSFNRTDFDTTSVINGRFDSWIKPRIAATDTPATGSRVVGNDQAARLLAPSNSVASNYGEVAWNDQHFGSSVAWNGRPLGSDLIIGPDVLEINGIIQPAGAGYTDEQAIAFFNGTNLEDANSPDPQADVWQDTAQAVAQLGESVRLATSSPARQATAGDHGLLVNGVTVSFVLESQPQPQSLTVTARLEGQMLKLTGTYTPPETGAAPTDFQAYVGEGQSFVLQTEDVPEPATIAEGAGEIIAWASLPRFDAGLSTTRFVHSSVLDDSVEKKKRVKVEVIREFLYPESNAANSFEIVNASNAGDVEARQAWSWRAPSVTTEPPAVRGVVISPMLDWSSAAPR